MGDRRQETEEERQEAGDRIQETEEGRQEPEDMRQETGDSRHVHCTHQIIGPFPYFSHFSHKNCSFW